MGIVALVEMHSWASQEGDDEHCCRDDKQ